MRALSHRRFRRAIGRYADGELDATSAQALAAHLLECDGCRRELAMVRAIKGSLQRLADAEPPALAATRLRRWTATLPGSGKVPSLRVRDHPRAVRLRFRPLVGIVAALAVATGLLLHQAGPSPDPGTMAALVELARLDSPGEGPEQRRGHALELGDQRVSLVRRIVDGREVLIASSDRAFAMPADARRVSRERDAPWLARRGDLSVACLSRPTHMLVVGPLPGERLIEIARQVRPP
jgi:hypothetical protein